MMKPRLIAAYYIGIFSLGLILAPQAANASLITNGSFEAPVVNGTLDDGSIYYYYEYNSTTASGWSMAGSHWTWMRSRAPYWVATDGNQYTEVEGSTGAIFQSFATEIGTKYSVNFDYAPTPGLSAASSDDALDVLVDGVSFLFLDGSDTTVDDLDWSNYSFDFVATSTFSELRFADGAGGEDFIGPFLDNVSVSVVPVPATTWLFGSALITLASIKRKKLLSKS